MYQFNKKQIEEHFTKCVDALKNHLGSLRTGRANPAFLDDIRVDVYGSKMKIKEIANVNVLDNFTLAVKPFDSSSLGQIAKGIQESGLGLNPIQDATLIRVPLPQITEERRKELAKISEKYGEEGKIAVRNVRRDENDKIKKAHKDKEISEDDLKKFEADVQKITDLSIKSIDEAVKVKIAEIMKV